MSYESNDISNYAKIYNNPDKALEYLDSNKKKNKNKQIKQNKKEDLIFQILDIDSYDIEDDDENKSFNIMLFGKTKEDKSVYVNIEGYRPYFYVEINSNWTKFLVTKIMRDIKEKVWPKDCVEGLLSYKIIESRKFYGFTNDEKFRFLRLEFADYSSMKAYERTFNKKHKMLYISRYRKVKFNLYESNIHPILRFLHNKDIDSIGWCKMEKKHMKEFDYNQKKGIADINVNCNYKNIERYECTDIHKFNILSFDIECYSDDGKFPQYDKDSNKIIQIGMTYNRLGNTECFKKVVLCLDDTADIEGAEVLCYKTEKELLLGFTKELIKNDPDIITGYNIFGFDFNYMKHRAEKLGIYTKFSRFSRIKGKVCKFIEPKLESKAMGRNILKYFEMPGRVCIDLMKVIQRDFKLSSYTLDSVAGEFIRDGITDYNYIREGDKKLKSKRYRKFVKEKLYTDDIYSSDDDDIDDNNNEDVYIIKKKDISKKKKILFTELQVKSTFGINKDDFIAIFYNDGPTDNRIGKKFRVLDIKENTIIVSNKVRLRPFLKKKWKVFWSQTKDDVSPNDIFKLYEGNRNDKSKVAKYCLKDCSLCNRLMAKLQILPNSIGMGNVCCVPLSYLYLRGQGIKIFSLVAKQCGKEKYLIPTIKKKKKKEENKDDKNSQGNKNIKTNNDKFKAFMKDLIDKDEDNDEDEQGYEGATVLVPTTGVHYDPIIVDDYGSLYPSSMIMKNLSHNSIVLDEKYGNVPGYKYHIQSFKNNDGTISTHKFAEKKNGDKATIPRILQKLLKERKKCKKMVKEEKDPFKKSVWDGLQLAYKVTANSLYGQCGSNVSSIFMKEIAACTTSIGRDMLLLACDYVEKEMTDILNLIQKSYEEDKEKEYLEYMRKFYKDVPDKRVKNDKYENKEEYFIWAKEQIYPLIKGYTLNPKTIYGDTDSVFFKLNMVNKKTGEKFNNHESLKVAIKIGILTSEIVNYTLDFPQVLEYEKVYWPFVIISKKRYVGNLYEFDPNKYKQKSMGLVTKRRDNADIVKVVVGGIINQILNHRSAKGAIEFTQSRLMRIITGKYNIDKFIITKTLKDKESYAEWTRIVHAVLADRMAKRDPGNKPQSNDRIPYVYIEVDKEVKLQGERVEHPHFIEKEKLKIDYLFYITNQIMKPSIQFLELIVKNPNTIFKKYIIREQNRQSHTEPIMKHLKDNISSNSNGNSLSLNMNGENINNLFNDVIELQKKENNNKKKRKRRIKRLL
jgi:DNA polymerase elongation subunit (family B)